MDYCRVEIADGLRRSKKGECTVVPLYLNRLTSAFVGQEFSRLAHLPDVSGLGRQNAIDLNAGNVATEDLHSTDLPEGRIQYIAECMMPSVTQLVEMLRKSQAHKSRAAHRRRTSSAPLGIPVGPPLSAAPTGPPTAWHAPVDMVI